MAVTGVGRSSHVEALGETLLRFWPATLGVFLLIIGAATYVFSYQPKLGERTWLEKELLRERKELEESRKRLQEPGPSEVGARTPWKEAEALLLTKIPRDRDLPAFVEELMQLLAESAIAKVSFPAIEEVKIPAAAPRGQGEEKFGYFLIKLTLRATYPDLIQLMESLERLTRLVEVESLKVTRDSPGILVELVIRAYHAKSGV